MGLIIPIGQWVLEEACRQLGVWQAQHPEAVDLSMAVNISRKQLSDPQLVAHLRRTIEATGVRPELLKLEITENVIMEHIDTSALETLAQIKATGALLAMDDFGTGYSSLSCLHKFPLDVLKLDRSFVADMGRKRDASAVVSGVVMLAHNLGLTVVAEGLEKPEQVAFLQALNCDIGQGYIFSKPLPADRAEQYILSSHQYAKSA
ncbi:MAG TPA: EAL domain-containing protein, partial [Tepidisphaeraceae bacterium]|jgi:EAL domain-containing protein (putative c-di-GMP-specific phosphodiesterase class I)